MTQIIFDATLFRQQFPAFSNATTFPTPTLQMYWDMGTCYISDDDYGDLSGSCRLLALNMMTAHLTQLSVQIAAGQTSYVIQGSTIDKISVTLTPPPLPNQFRWWLQTTVYGQQLLSLLQVNSSGGFYYGGLPEPLAIRKYGGIF